MLQPLHVSVITSTCQRPGMLATVLGCFKNQMMAGINAEHIVCSDGPCRLSPALAKDHGAKYYELKKRGIQGTHCKDKGAHESQGQYLIFWDDDNWYEPFAISSLLSCAWGSDLGVAKVKTNCNGEMVTIPRQQKKFTFGDIDTACFCIRRSLAVQLKWEDQEYPGRDYHFLESLVKLKPNLTVRYTPLVIATHVGFRMNKGL